MKKMVMYVYSDIQTDARVKRAANALANKYELTLLSSDCGVLIRDEKYRNVLLKCEKKGLLGYFQSIKSALKIIKEKKPDIVYAHDYFSALLVRIVLYRGLCKKVVYDAHEIIIPDNKNNNARMKFFYWQERAIIKKVGLVVCASRERSIIMKDHYHLSKAPLVVENISYLDTSFDISQLEVYSELHEFFSISLPTIVYAGVVASSRKLDVLLDFAAQQAPSYKLLVVGKGDALQSLKERAVGYPDLRCCFTGAVPYVALGAILSKCDIGYLYYPTDTLNNINCASNKVYEYASVGLPILANNNPTIKRMLDHWHIGLASDDLGAALAEVRSSLTAYKESCGQFIVENSWDSTSLELLNQVSNL